MNMGFIYIILIEIDKEKIYQYQDWFLLKIHLQLCEEWQCKRFISPTLRRHLYVKITYSLQKDTQDVKLAEYKQGHRTYCSFCDYRKESDNDLLNMLNADICIAPKRGLANAVVRYFSLITTVILNFQ